LAVNRLEDPVAVLENLSMALDEDLAGHMRAVLGGTGAVREVRMFGGLCFMLNGNMVAGTSKRGLLVRVGKEQYSQALARPSARPMEMSGRRMAGYILVDPPPHDERALRDWLGLAVGFVNTLPAKLPRSKPGPTKTS
jgi:TfoX/Sxy family transcriptional regulator of competence genes